MPSSVYFVVFCVNDDGWLKLDLNFVKHHSKILITTLIDWLTLIVQNIDFQFWLTLVSWHVIKCYQDYFGENLNFETNFKIIYTLKYCL